MPPFAERAPGYRPPVTSPHLTSFRSVAPGGRPGDDGAASGPGAARSPRGLGGPAGLVLSLAVVAVVAALGASWTDTAPGSWYDRLDQPPWNPPDWLFGPVWTALYAAMAVAAWLVARRGVQRREVRAALVLYAAQLVFNLGWTAVFFALQRPGWAVAEIAILLGLVVATIVAFRRVRPVAAYLLVPYAAWVTYAGALTVAIAALN